jgi:hypothetical protein
VDGELEGVPGELFLVGVEGDGQDDRVAEAGLVAGGHVLRPPPAPARADVEGDGALDARVRLAALVEGVVVLVDVLEREVAGALRADVREPEAAAAVVGRASRQLVAHDLELAAEGRRERAPQRGRVAAHGRAALLRGRGGGEQAERERRGERADLHGTLHRRHLDGEFKSRRVSR